MNDLQPSNHRYALRRSISIIVISIGVFALMYAVANEQEEIIELFESPELVCSESGWRIEEEEGPLKQPTEAFSWQAFAEDLKLWVTMSELEFTYENSRNTYKVRVESWQAFEESIGLWVKCRRFRANCGLLGDICSESGWRIKGEEGPVKQPVTSFSWTSHEEGIGWVNNDKVEITFENSGNTYIVKAQSWLQALEEGKGSVRHSKVSATGGLFGDKGQTCSYP